MTDKQIEKISKFLSYVLRHHPESVNLTLDANGWADVDALLQGARRQSMEVDRELLQHVIATNNKKRFALSDDGTRIRASQGHSVMIDLELAPQIPPAILYHGTSTRFWKAIQQEGLQKGQRQHVHLSTDMETATAVGKRHGKVLVLEIAAGQMAADGFVFYLSDNGVWLSDQVPVAYLTPLP